MYQNISLPNILLKHKNYNELMVLRKSRHRRSYKNNLIPRPSLVAQVVKTLSATQETRGGSMSQEDTLKKGMATHSSILAWRIPWTGEPGRLESMRSLRAGHNWAADTYTNGNLHLYEKSPFVRVSPSLSREEKDINNSQETYLRKVQDLNLLHLVYCGFPAQFL